MDTHIPILEFYPGEARIKVRHLVEAIYTLISTPNDKQTFVWTDVMRATEEVDGLLARDVAQEELTCTS